MLKFASLHGIKPQIETIPFSAEGCKDACTRVEENTERFRAVLVFEGSDGM